MQVNALSFKVILKEDLLQSMLDGSIAGPITADSLGRVMQCFGPCLQLGISSSEGRSHGIDSSEARPGFVFRTGELCNALLTAASVGYLSSVRRLNSVADTGKVHS
jgi:hypothetical protein